MVRAFLAPRARSTWAALPVKGCKQDFAIDIFGKMLGQRGLAGAGIAEQPEDRRTAILEPARDGLERLILLG
jgi:hypothetical protein